jgi:hypothetical protein
MSATSSSFFRAGVGDAGETITTSVLASRCDSSPVISLAPHHPDLNSFWIGRLNTTTGLKPQREGELLDHFGELFEVVDEEPHFEVSRFIVRRTKDRRWMDCSHDVGSKS